MLTREAKKMTQDVPLCTNDGKTFGAIIYVLYHNFRFEILFIPIIIFKQF